jgi:hypothetical protein
MATNKIQVTLEVDDKGSVKLKQFGDSAKQAKNEVEKTGRSMSTSFGKGADDIAKMTTGLTKFVAGGAAAVVAVKAIQTAIQQANVGNFLLKQEEAFSSLSKAAGTTSDVILQAMKKASKGMVDDANLIKAAGTSMMLGIPADKLADLMQIAEATSRQTGQSVTEAFADITLAVGRGSKMILDNLGIIVDVEKANKTYAQSLGKTSDALTDAERKQAFMNATLTAGKDLVGKIGEGKESLNASAKFAASLKNAVD